MKKIWAVLLSALLCLAVFAGCSDKAPEESGETGDGKTYISFLGDSISTYAGYSNGTQFNATIANNAVWFPNTNYAGADMAVESTWWHRVLSELGYELCVNNSWSGSVVNAATTYETRAANLHNESGRKPDVVVIFMGVNDFAANTKVGSYDGIMPPPSEPTDFSTAYGLTVQTVMDTYPAADVYCCTFLPDRKRFSGEYNKANISETRYNRAIADIAENRGATLVDLYNDCGISAGNLSQYTVDRLHPNAEGMGKIADAVIEAVRGNAAA